MWQLVENFDFETRSFERKAFQENKQQNVNDDNLFWMLTKLDKLKKCNVLLWKVGQNNNTISWVCQHKQAERFIKNLKKAQV